MLIISVPAGNGQAGRAPDSRDTILSSSPDRRHYYYYKSKCISRHHLTVPPVPPGLNQEFLVGGPPDHCAKNNSIQNLQKHFLSEGAGSPWPPRWLRPPPWNMKSTCPLTPFHATLLLIPKCNGMDLRAL